MSKNIENHDSVLLLQDCIAGCKMALESMDDIREHTDDKQLRELIDKYYDEHTGLSVDCRDMLDKAGADIKEPGVFAKMAAKLQTAMKMAVNDDQSQAAKLLTEGCNMGIETISGSLNEYRDADSKSVQLQRGSGRLRKKWLEICSHYYKKYKITAVVPNQYNSGIDLWSDELSDLCVKAVCSFIISSYIIEDLQQQNT